MRVDPSAFVSRITAKDPFMKIPLDAGLLLVVLGIASLVVPIPRGETHSIKAGDINIGVQTTHSEPRIGNH
jgi:hypothetical protein